MGSGGGGSGDCCWWWWWWVAAADWETKIVHGSWKLNALVRACVPALKKLSYAARPWLKNNNKKNQTSKQRGSGSRGRQDLEAMHQVSRVLEHSRLPLEVKLFASVCSWLVRSLQNPLCVNWCFLEKHPTGRLDTVLLIHAFVFHNFSYHRQWQSSTV